MPTNRPLISIVAALISLALFACGEAGPSIDTIDNQVVAVGGELVLEISASNDSGADIRFDFDTSATIDAERGGLTQRPGGSALFTWTPSAQDIGTWSFDFRAKDSTGTATETITIEVRSAIGQDTLPVFRRPLGAGTALDVGSDTCVEIDVLVEDLDSLEVELTQEEPIIEGGELIQENGSDLAGKWRWCPTRAQVQAQDRYMLTIGANDKENPKALKHYQIILREPTTTTCPGEAPEIRHTAADVETVNELEITANVTDDRGIKASVDVYYSLERPADPPVLQTMIRAPMELTSGSPDSGSWTVFLPNPVAEEEVGASADIYYVIVAEDNDDKTGKCDHSTIESYSMTVTSNGLSGNLGICEPCSHDRQCGRDTDLCLAAGPESDRFCFTSCETDAECPGGYICSPEDLTSPDGNSGKQCIPNDGTCSRLPCEDDAFENNDGISQRHLVEAGQLEDLRMCPFKLHAADEDWFEFEVTEDSEVMLQVLGANDDPNIDMRLLDSAGNLIGVSEDFGSLDEISRCLQPGTYYVRAYSYLFYKIFTNDELNDMGNDYTLSLTMTTSQCSTDATCEDDVFEDDDNIDQTRIPDFGGFDKEWSATGNQICEKDQDWFLVSAYSNANYFSISLDFEQFTPDQDLDILIYDQFGGLVTECIEGNTGGCSNNGQSGDSNEFMVFFPPVECSLPLDCEGCEPCDYYIVVNGFAGAENAYDICIGYDSQTTCLE